MSRCELIQYLNDGPPEGRTGSLPQAIREYLEGNLRGRFPAELESARNLGEMLGRIRTAMDGSPLRRLLARYDELDRINEFVTRYCHLAGDRPPGEPLDGELRPIVELALDIGWG